ncbi:hypothetical protein [Streptomyces sp. ITFR-16]|uniref:hypothetical protein n=1 Tax=Streptomyces sp. ITFR-16 TaxID=3075198 RepID=UPI002889B0C4|nr:hypothetical protein [Streptomyces sp. ITFR-16]WNI22394.1 hypothetical protein RLT58_10845 [Streptomyces sp. ITFR-16]
MAHAESAAAAELLFADGRLVAVGDALAVLKGADGSRLAGVAAGGITCRDPVLRANQLLCAGSDGLTVVVVTDPARRRTLAPGVDVAYRPAVSRDGIVVASSKHMVYAFGLGDGQMRWSTCDCGEGLETAGAPSVAGPHAVILQGYGPGAVAMASEGEAKRVGTDLLTEWPAEPGAPLDDVSGISLIAQGDALYLSFEDGTVLSAYAP